MKTGHLVYYKGRPGYLWEDRDTPKTQYGIYWVSLAGIVVEEALDFYSYVDLKYSLPKHPVSDRYSRPWRQVQPIVDKHPHIRYIPPVGDTLPNPGGLLLGMFGLAWMLSKALICGLAWLCVPGYAQWEAERERRYPDRGEYPHCPPPPMHKTSGWYPHPSSWD